MNLKYVLSLSVKLFVFLTFLFARTFMGLSYYGIRLGEILIAASAAILIIYTVFIPIIKKKYFLDNKRLNLILVLLIASFYLSYVLSCMKKIY